MKEGDKMRTLIIPLLLLVAVPAQAETTSTARQLLLLDMRTRTIRPITRNVIVIQSGIGSYRYINQTARQRRAIRRYDQNHHRREWQQSRRDRRFYRSLYR